MKHHKYRDRGLTLLRIKELLVYEEDSGKFTWKVHRGRLAKIGSIAGNISKDGYVRLMIDGFTYLVHCLVWFYKTGAWATSEVDHKDLNKSNNRFNNLREATPKQNCANRKKRSDSKNLYKGVSKKCNKWRSSIMINGKRVQLGYFNTPEEAHTAYVEKAIKINSSYARGV